MQVSLLQVGGGPRRMKPWLSCTSSEKLALWNYLEDLVRQHVVRGTRYRTNLAPDAPRDERGRLVDPRPSDMIRSGKILRVCQYMNADFDFTAVEVNKFRSHLECQLHVDKRNVGDSRIALMGSFQGTPCGLRTAAGSMRNISGILITDLK